MRCLLWMGVKVLQPRIARVFTNGERLRRRISLLVLFAFICSLRGSNRWCWCRVAGRGGPRVPTEGKSRQSQTAATGGTCRFVGCLMSFLSLTKRDLPLVDSNAKNFRVFWDRDCLQLPWRAQPASFSRPSGGARGGFFYITAWVSARRSHAPGHCTGYRMGCATFT